MQTLKRPLSSNDQLYFIHVPKCAGTTFINIVDQHFTIGEILPTHYDLKKLETEISNEQLAGYRFLRGHIPYDTLIPRLPALPRMITFLRDPVAQFISYFQMRQRVPDPLVGIQSTLAGLSLEELLEHELMLRFANNATVSIGGRLPAQASKDRIPNLELAKERLKTFDFVGITERFNDSLDLFSYIFNFYPISAYETLNVSPDREKRQEISPDLMARIAEVQKYDIELYQFGLKILEEKYQQMLAEKRQGQADVVLSQPVANVFWDLSRAQPCQGWHIAESHPAFGLTRWSGPETSSRLYIPLEKNKDYILRFQVLSDSFNDILSGLVVQINGTPVALAHVRQGMQFMFEGRIPAKLVAQNANPVCLEFSVNRVIAEGNEKGRKLGLCYNWVQITSL